MTNPYPLFKFIEDKKGIKIPLKYKLVYAPETITKEDLYVKEDLWLYHTSITSLPDNLKVGGNLDLAYTKITSLPNNLQVGGSLWLANTPLSQKYTKEEIRKMIKDKGGYVKGRIYM